MPRVKVATVKKTLKNKDIQSLFQQAIGTDTDGPLPVHVVWPKFKLVRHQLLRTLKTAEWIVGCDWMEATFPSEREQIMRYFTALRKEYEAFKTSVPDLDATQDPMTLRLAQADPEIEQSLVPDEVPPALLAEFSTKYRAAIQCDLINTVIVICKNLTNHKKSIENKDSLSPHFLRSAGLSFAPFPEMPAANFKAFYNDLSLTAADRDNVLYYLHKLYHCSHAVYEAVSKPDIDIEEFVQVVAQSIDQVQKHMGGAVQRTRFGS